MINNDSGSKKQIIIGSVLSYGTIFVDIILGLLYTPWMIRMIGKSDYGLYTLALSVITMFMMDFGIGSAISRFVSKYRAENDENAIEKFLGVTLKLYLLIDIIIFIIIIVCYLFIQNIFVELTPSEISKFKVIFLISGMFSVISFLFTPLNGIIMSFEKFGFLKVVGLLSKLLTVLCIVIALLFNAGVYALVVVNAAVGLIGIIVKYIYVKNKIGIKINYKFWDLKLVKEILSFSAFVAVIIILEQLTLNICPTILGSIGGGTSQISYFSVGRTIYTYIYGFSAAIGGLFLPKVSKMLNINEDPNSINNLAIKIGRIQLLIVGILVVGFFSVGKDFMLLWMGKDFSSSYYVALFLAVPSLVISTQNIHNNIMMAKGKMKYGMYSGAITTIICLALNFLLAPKFGAVGAAFAFLIASIVGNVIVQNILYQKYLKINILKFFKECQLSMILPICLSIIVGIILNLLIGKTTIIFFILKGVIVIVTYIVSMWIISLNQSEKEMIKSIFKKTSSRIFGIYNAKK